MKLKLTTLILFVAIQLLGQTTNPVEKYPPFVNQAGYNLGESKRFVCYGAKDGTPFKIADTKTDQIVFEGKMSNNQG